MVFAMLCFGQKPTYAALTGREWTALTKEAKITYFAGFMDALNSWGTEAARSPKSSDAVPFGQRIVDITDSLDGFYSEAANRQIPVSWALSWVSRKFSGLSEPKLKELETALRAKANELQ